VWTGLYGLVSDSTANNLATSSQQVAVMEFGKDNYRFRSGRVGVRVRDRVRLRYN